MFSGLSIITLYLITKKKTKNCLKLFKKLTNKTKKPKHLKTFFPKNLGFFPATNKRLAVKSLAAYKLLHSADENNRSYRPNAFHVPVAENKVRLLNM